MNWYKAKTILIVFLVITNAFLLFNIIFNVKDGTYISDKTISETAAILHNNGIDIDESIIPHKNVNAGQFEADNIIEGYQSFAEKLLGENPEKISDTQYTSEKGTLEFSGDFFAFTQKGDVSHGDEKMDRELLHSLGIDISDYVYQQGVFSKKVNKLNVFNSRLSVDQNEQGEVTVSGVWFEKNSNKILSPGTMKPITAVLIDFISSPERPQGGISIVNLEWGYTVYETEVFHKSIVPVPVWKIELSDGEKIYMDARNN